VKIEGASAARILTLAARSAACTTPDVDEQDARKLVAKINEREGHRVDYD
jgi:hypothetical protein